MIQLYQFPWSPYCLVQARILDYGRIPYKSVRISATDRQEIWRLSRERYYEVPLLKDGRNVLFELDHYSQVIAKYLDAKFNLDLFPPQFAGLQRILWRYIENDVELLTFKLNDIHYREFVPRKEHCSYIRHKERRFGRGCVDTWRQQRTSMMAELTELLVPFEQMLATRPFLLDDQPRFVDVDLWGMLSNYLFSGHYKLPSRHARIKRWYRRVAASRIKAPR